MASKSSSSAENSGSDRKKVTNKLSGTAITQIVILVGLLAIQSVPWGDILFAVFASLYIYMMSRLVFPNPKVQPGPWIFSGSRFVKRYAFFAGILGIILPVALIVISFLVGDQTTVQAAAPHLFLVSAQVLSENLTFGSSLALPVKAFIPIMYNARRLINLHTWAATAFSEDFNSSVSEFSTVWNLFGRGVVVGNVLLWHYNLWGFLLPVFLPWALRTYYTSVITGDE